MPRGAVPTKGQLYLDVRKSQRQLETFNNIWGKTLSLVVLCSDKEQGFEPREIYGIEHGLTLWEILLQLEKYNNEVENKHLFEYIICQDLPILQIPEYTLEMIYSHFITLKSKPQLKAADSLDDFSDATAHIRNPGQQINGMSIE